jgi:hypothetical protein
MGYDGQGKVQTIYSRVSTTDSSRRREKLVVKRVTWCGENASVACLATIIERQLDAMQYVNHKTLANITRAIPQVCNRLHAVHLIILGGPRRWPPCCDFPDIRGPWRGQPRGQRHE